jgi:ATP-dependent Clp protease ATP-binding subunit ClpX
VWYIYFRFVKKLKKKQGEYRKIRHGSHFKRLLVDFPRQLVKDYLTRDPDYFKEYGVHIVAGEQGKGKTVAVVYMMMWLKKQYPRLEISTNMEYKHEDSAILDWKDMISNSNGIYGKILCIDELQNWFSSNQSKDFPVEMITELTQQRKDRKMILATSQVFTRVSKPIREQTYYLYQPFTIAGCLTIVPKFKVDIKADSGNPDKKRIRGLFYFVHNEELRESFDTYHKIERMAKEGFKPDESRAGSPVTVNLPK